MAAVQEENAQKSLFVTNLRRQVSDEILYELFLQAGPIDTCVIMGQRVGHVVFKHAESVQYAQDIFKGTALYGEELSMATEYALPESQAALRGVHNGMGPMDHGYRGGHPGGHGGMHYRHDDMQPGRGWRDQRYDPYYDRRRPEPRHEYRRDDRPRPSERYSRRDDRRRR